MSCQLAKKLGSEGQLGCNRAQYPRLTLRPDHHSSQAHRQSAASPKARDLGLLGVAVLASLHYLRNGLSRIMVRRRGSERAQPIAAFCLPPRIGAPKANFRETVSFRLPRCTDRRRQRATDRKPAQRLVPRSPVLIALSRVLVRRSPFYTLNIHQTAFCASA